jgi:hypothetical protein
MASRTDARRLRSRRRRRGLVRGVIRVIFWTIVLAGVFILGLGYGKTLSGEDEQRSDKVTVTESRGAIVATLPTETVTVTTTVQAKPKAKQSTSAGRASTGTGN